MLLKLWLFGRASNVSLVMLVEVRAEVTSSEIADSLTSTVWLTEPTARRGLKSTLEPRVTEMLACLRVEKPSLLTVTE